MQGHDNATDAELGSKDDDTYDDTDAEPMSVCPGTPSRCFSQYIYLAGPVPRPQQHEKELSGGLEGPGSSCDNLVRLHYLRGI
jgi:hypothetical protein